MLPPFLRTMFLIHTFLPAHSPQHKYFHFFCIFSSTSSSSSSSSPPLSTASFRRRSVRTSSPRKVSLKRLTSRVVELTRRKQLNQIFDEVEIAKRQYGQLNTIVMNAVIEACVSCGNIDSALKVFDEMAGPDGCGVDNVSYGTLLKGLGQAHRVDQAFQLLESVEQGTAKGSPKLSAPLIYGFLNALIEAGDMRRANGLLARYGYLLREGGSLSISVYNLLMKGYITTGFQQAAMDLYDEILRLGVKPDSHTYNTLIAACVKTKKLDTAIHFFEDMKVRAVKCEHYDLFPDVVTYTTLLKGFGNSKDLITVQKIVLEMKSCHDLFIDRTAYTAIIDALLDCGSIKGALSIYGELLKLAGGNQNFWPKPHLYLSLMRAFAVRGDYDMVQHLHNRMWPDSTGNISLPVQEEADHLLMEAALNDGQVDVAIQNLACIIRRWKGISWTSRGGRAALQVEALLGFTKSMFSPYLLPQINLSAPIESIMTPFEATQPLNGTLLLNKVVRRFFKEKVIPVVDDWGSCTGLLHREDCSKLNAPVATMMRSPPRVTSSTPISHVADLILGQRYKMVVILKESNYSTNYSSSLRAIGVFTAEQLYELITPPRANSFM